MISLTSVISKFECVFVFLIHLENVDLFLISLTMFLSILKKETLLLLNDL